MQIAEKTVVQFHYDLSDANGPIESSREHDPVLYLHGQTGRSEPRLSVGKRIAERVRLSAQTGLGESREFRGALDWQLDDNQRIGLSYDNYNINGTNSFGNLGIDWGYRLEFE